MHLIIHDLGFVGSQSVPGGWPNVSAGKIQTRGASVDVDIHSHLTGLYRKTFDARSRHQGQGQVITFHRYRDMQLLSLPLIPASVIFWWVSKARTSNYIPRILWNVITCPCP